jgi:hypothetical protein
MPHAGGADTDVDVRTGVALLQHPRRRMAELYATRIGFAAASCANVARCDATGWVTGHTQRGIERTMRSPSVRSRPAAWNPTPPVITAA